MEIVLKSKLEIATLTLTPSPEGSEPTGEMIAMVKEFVAKTFEEHVKVDLPDLRYEVDVVPGDKYKFIVSACFTFKSPVVDRVNEMLKEFGI